LLISGAGILTIVGLVYLSGRSAVEPGTSRQLAATPAASDQPLASSSVPGQPIATGGAAQTKPPAPASPTDLLAAIEKQASPVVKQEDMASEASWAAAMKIWIDQDKVMHSWPKYQDVRDELRRELGALMDLDSAALAEMRSEASRLQTEFWQQEGYRSAQGYRQAYKARLLMEIAHKREPGNLAVADELVNAIQTGTPISRYDAESREMERNAQVVQELQALRAETYTQTRKEIEQGRAFTWADFARTADYTQLWSSREPKKAAEAFEWALSHTSSEMYPELRTRVMAELGRGGSVSFSIYEKTRGKYPRDFMFARRLPSYRGPNPEARGLTPRWTIGSDRSAGR
jgi:hypothetical protein